MAKIIKSWYQQGDRTWKITFYTSQGVSILLILVSFFIPPIAVIDSSIFAAVGELAFFPSLYAFYNILRSGRQATLKKGELEVTVAQEEK